MGRRRRGPRGGWGCAGGLKPRGGIPLHLPLHLRVVLRGTHALRSHLVLRALVKE